MADMRRYPTDPGKEGRAADMSLRRAMDLVVEVRGQRRVLHLQGDKKWRIPQVEPIRPMPKVTLHAPSYVAARSGPVRHFSPEEIASLNYQRHKPKPRPR